MAEPERIPEAKTLESQAGLQAPQSAAAVAEKPEGAWEKYFSDLREEISDTDYYRPEILDDI